MHCSERLGVRLQAAPHAALITLLQLLGCDSRAVLALAAALVQSDSHSYGSFSLGRTPPAGTVAADLRLHYLSQIVFDTLDALDVLAITGTALLRQQRIGAAAAAAAAGPGGATINSNQQDAMVGLRDVQQLQYLLAPFVLYCGACWYGPGNDSALCTTRFSSMAVEQLECKRWVHLVRAGGEPLSAAWDCEGLLLQHGSSGIPGDVHAAVLEDLLSATAVIGGQIGQQLTYNSRASSSSSTLGGASYSGTASAFDALSMRLADAVADERGRLARAKISLRLIDVLFSVSLLAARSPAGTSGVNSTHTEPVSLPLSTSTTSDGSMSPAAMAALWEQHALTVAQMLDAAVRSATPQNFNMLFPAPQALYAAELFEMLAASCGFISSGGSGNTYMPGPLLLATLSFPPGSTLEQQMVSMLCSVLKLVAACEVAGVAASVQLHACIAAVVSMVYIMISREFGLGLALHAAQHPTVGDAADGSLAGLQEGRQTAGSTAVASTMLSWLVLTGRCCLQVAAALKRDAAAAAAAATTSTAPALEASVSISEDVRDLANRCMLAIKDACIWLQHSSDSTSEPTTSVPVATAHRASARRHSWQQQFMQ